MSDLNDKLDLIKTARDDIKTVLTNKGQTVNNDIRTYANAVDSLGSVKQFDTIANMQADLNAKEGDLAIVYRNQLQPITETSEFSSCTFPSTVTLPSAVSSSIRCYFEKVSGSSGYFDGNARLTASQFRFNGEGEDEYYITYTSSDGIHYTRTDGGEATISFGTTIHCTEGWNDLIGNFMVSGGMYFEGLYRYGNITYKDRVQFAPLSSITFDYTGSSITNIKYDGTVLPTVYQLSRFTNIRKAIVNELSLGDVKAVFFLNNNDELCVAVPINGTGEVRRLYADLSLNPLGFGESGRVDVDCVNIYKINNDDTYTLLQTIKGTGTNTFNYTPYTNIKTVPVIVGIADASREITIYIQTGQGSENHKGSISLLNRMGDYPFYNTNEYIYAQTQLTLDSDSQLMSGVIAYGKNGIHESNDTILSNFSYADFMAYNNVDVVENTLYNVPKDYTGITISTPSSYSDFQNCINYYNCKKITPINDNYYKVISSETYNIWWEYNGSHIKVCDKTNTVLYTAEITGIKFTIYYGYPIFKEINNILYIYTNGKFIKITEQQATVLYTFATTDNNTNQGYFVNDGLYAMESIYNQETYVRTFAIIFIDFNGVKTTLHTMPATGGEVYNCCPSFLLYNGYVYFTSYGVNTVEHSYVGIIDNATHQVTYFSNLSKIKYCTLLVKFDNKLPILYTVNGTTYEKTFYSISSLGELTSLGTTTCTIGCPMLNGNLYYINANKIIGLMNNTSGPEIIINDACIYFDRYISGNTNDGGSSGVLIQNVDIDNNRMEIQGIYLMNSDSANYDFKWTINMNAIYTQSNENQLMNIDKEPFGTSYRYRGLLLNNISPFDDIENVLLAENIYGGEI